MCSDKLELICCNSPLNIMEEATCYLPGMWWPYLVPFSAQYESQNGSSPVLALCWERTQEVQRVWLLQGTITRRNTRERGWNSTVLGSPLHLWAVRSWPCCKNWNGNGNMSPLPHIIPLSLGDLWRIKQPFLLSSPLRCGQVPSSSLY